jgi:hypothetical protein
MRLIASYDTAIIQPTMATLTRLPRTPNIERATTPLGVPELGPLTASRPTSPEQVAADDHGHGPQT